MPGCIPNPVLVSRHLVHPSTSGVRSFQSRGWLQQRNHDLPDTHTRSSGTERIGVHPEQAVLKGIYLFREPFPGGQTYSNSLAVRYSPYQRFDSSTTLSE